MYSILRTSRLISGGSCDSLPICQCGEVLKNQVFAACLLVEEVDKLLFVNEVDRIEALTYDADVEIALFVFCSHADTVKEDVNSTLRTAARKPSLT